MKTCMSRGAVAALTLALLTLAGCSTFDRPAAPAQPRPIGASTAPVGGTCDGQGAQWAVGKSATAAVLEQARVRAGARMARVLHPGQMVTQEFDGQRLTLQLDAAGKVSAARCG